MAKHGKKFRAAKARVEPRAYEVDAAVALAKDATFARFDETFEVAMLLGVDPKHADQMVRGTVVLPHGTGRSKRVSGAMSGPQAARTGSGVSPRRLAPAEHSSVRDS